MADEKDRENPERQPGEDEPELTPDPDLVSYLDEEVKPDPELESHEGKAAPEPQRRREEPARR